MEALSVTHFSDPGCPWAYSASPALATLRWRYGDQLDWRLVLIGLTEDARQYEERGYTPVGLARAFRSFRRWGLPLATTPKLRVAATSRACRAVVAARLQAPELGDAALRALQLAQFTTTRLLDNDEDLVAALRPVEHLDADETVARIDDPEVLAAYETDRREAREAAGSPAEVQGKTVQTDGPVRFTAPSLVFEREDGARLVAGGFQPVEAYDVLITNLLPEIERRAVPAEPLEALEAETGGLVTAEVAEVMRQGNAPGDRAAAEDALIEATARGDAIRVPLGDDALWIAASHARSHGPSVVAEPAVPTAA